MKLVEGRVGAVEHACAVPADLVAPTTSSAVTALSTSGLLKGGRSWTVGESVARQVPT